MNASSLQKPYVPPFLPPKPMFATVVPDGPSRTSGPGPYLSPILPYPVDVPALPEPVAPQSTTSTQIAKKPIGMPEDLDAKAKHGVYAVDHLSPAPDTTCTLILELLPKKFRNVHFVQSWGRRFAKQREIRVDLDAQVGKALIEFPSEDVAQAAFGSPRLGGEGKEHIRAYWYRVGERLKQSQIDLEEGEIEEDDEVYELPVPVVQAPPKNRKQKKAAKRKAKEEAAAAAMSISRDDDDALFAALLFRPRTQSSNFQEPLAAPTPPAPPPPPDYGVEYHTPQYYGGYSAQYLQPGAAYAGPSSAPSHDAWEPAINDEQPMDLASSDAGYDMKVEILEQATAEAVDDMDYDSYSIASSRASPITPAIDLPYEQYRSPSSKQPAKELSALNMAPLPPPTSAAEPATKHPSPYNVHTPLPGVNINPLLWPKPAPLPEVNTVPLPWHLLTPTVAQKTDTLGMTRASIERDVSSQQPLWSLPQEQSSSVVQTPQSVTSRPPADSLIRAAAAASAASPEVPVQALDPTRLKASSLSTLTSLPSTTVSSTPAIMPGGISQAHPPSRPETAWQPSAPSKPDLLQRQQLQQRITKLEQELARRNGGASASASGSASPVIGTTASVTERIEKSTEDESATALRLDPALAELRRSVLATRGHASAATKTITASSTLADAAQTDPIDDAEITTTIAVPKPSLVVHAASTVQATVFNGNATSSSTPSRSTTATPSTASTAASSSEKNINLDDMAVSFITATLQAVRPALPSLSSSVPPPPSTPRLPQLDEKTRLAAHQQRLEELIAESQRLLTQHAQARSKAERQRILGDLRECTRTMDNMKSISLSPRLSPLVSPTPIAQQQRQQLTLQALMKGWPETTREATIIIISDDEDASDDDD